ncbi:transglutaminase domain-containing protein [Paenibacillus pinistramenti]|uniref:transglutaminase domain-containing protein n=1 Tax=Paenibacillus pinistramenti TaxID=1768003 RepID=UPI001107C339|nr:transglutaminase domain-containing protein [Paenibacillus pinistramenti]
MELQTPVFALSEQELENMEQRFKEKLEIGAARRQELFGIFDEPLTPEERFALRFLYAYMPLNDMADYDGALFLSHVRHALAARQQTGWGSRIPDSVFLHFVLPYRVNNENIEDYRGVIYEELAPRVQGLPMEEAILETNYWCYEKATYTGSDARTLSPLGMIRNARGRCGEESTLAVAALRSIGIPARQCYTPRWAHCDDNHAWVEAWADGTWHYIGACEPEARLDQGWFSGPARRAMLVHSRVPAQYGGPEAITYSDQWHTEINLLDNYAPTRIITVCVKDAAGAAVTGAEVQFQLYNYAELFPLAQLKTDGQGEASFKTGFGELLVRAVHEEAWGQIQLTAEGASRLEVVLDQTGQPLGSEDFTLVPPPEIPDPEREPLTGEAKRRHEERVAEGAAFRAAYEAGFMSEADAAELARGLKLPEDRVWSVLQKARGNSREIALFLEEYSLEHGVWPLNLLEALNDKDLTDTGREVLKDHLEGALLVLSGEAEADADADADAEEEESFIRYILRPRVLFEMLMPYRKAIRSAFTDEETAAFRKNPFALAERLNREWEIRDELTHLRGKAAPSGTFALKKGDSVSVDLCFVAVCRSLGIPARLHPSELYPQFKDENGWHNVEFDGHPRTSQQPAGIDGAGSIRFLQYADGIVDRDSQGGQNAAPEPPKSAAPEPSNSTAPEPSYGENFTLARLENGSYKTLVYPHAKKDFYDGPLEAEAGQYRMTTGIRLKDGTVLGRFAYFEVLPGRETAVPITFQQPDQEIPVLGQAEPQTRFEGADGSTFTLAEAVSGLSHNGTSTSTGISSSTNTSQTRGALVAFLEPEREPTKHLLRETSELAEAFELCGAPVIFVIGEPDAAGEGSSLNASSYPDLPSTAAFVLDQDGSALQAFAAAVPLGSAGYPHLFVLDGECRIRYRESGYKPGSGKEALGVLTGIQPQSN